MYDGTQAQLIRNWGDRASYPLLQRGSSLALIDPTGRLLSSFRRFNPLSQVRQAVQKAVADLAQDEPEPVPEPTIEVVPDAQTEPEGQMEEPVRTSTWGQVKTEAL